MEKIPLVDLSIQYKKIEHEIIAAITRVLDSSAFILSPQVDAFEEEFAKYCGTKYCVGLDNGSSALELGLRTLGVGQGDEIITPVNSFIASSSAISFVGAKPVWIDCDEKTYTIDTSKIEKLISKKTKAIMPVHLYGQPANMEKILLIAKKHKLYVVEDACQAHGAMYKGKKVGSFGVFSAFSFYPGKNLGAFGDAGAIVTNDRHVYETVKKMRNYGQSKKYHHDFLAWNRRLDSLQAAILRVKLKYLDLWNMQRIKHADSYDSLLKDTEVITPYKDPRVKHVYHQYVIRSKHRNALQTYLEKRGILTGIHYPIPIHLQKAYRFNGAKKGDFPVSEKYSREMLSLPMYPELKKEDIMHITNKIKSHQMTKVNE